MRSSSHSSFFILKPAHKFSFLKLFMETLDEPSLTNGRKTVFYFYFVWIVRARYRAKRSSSFHRKGFTFSSIHFYRWSSNKRSDSSQLIVLQIGPVHTEPIEKKLLKYQLKVDFSSTDQCSPFLSLTVCFRSFHIVHSRLETFYICTTHRHDADVKNHYFYTVLQFPSISTNKMTFFLLVHTTL